MTPEEIQSYIDEFNAYAATVGLTIDVNPLDSPIFKAWLASKYPGLVITPATPNTPATITKTMFGLTQGQLLMAAAGLTFILVWPKKRSKR